MLNVDSIRSIPNNIRQDVRTKTLNELFKNPYCKKCGLYKKVKNPFIEGRGNKGSSLLIIGEAPGKNEDDTGEPFIGKAGKILQEKLNDFEIDCYISNSVRCRPTDEQGKNRTPTPTMVKCCYPYTVKLIQEMKPKVILTLGKIAMDQVLGLNMGMTISRGKQFYHSIFKCHIITTFHPMYLGRANDRLFYKQFDEDLLDAKQLSFSPPTRVTESHPISLTDPIDIEQFLIKLLDVNEFAFDLETEGLNPRIDRITDISFCTEVGQPVHIKWEDVVPFYELLKEIFENEKIKKICHNGVFDIKFLRSVGIEVKGFNFDTLLAEHTLTMDKEGREITGLYRLKTLAWLHTPLGGYETVLGEGGIVKAQTKRKDKKEETEIEERSELDNYAMSVFDGRREKMEEAKLDPIPYYSSLDSDVTYRVYLKQKRLIDKNYSNLFYDLIIPLSQVLMKMEDNGIKLDVAYMKKIREDNDIKIEECRKELYDINGREFNIDSPIQLKGFVFNKLKVKPNNKFKTQKGAISLNVTALEYYSKKEPILKKILKFRNIRKQTSTYIDGFLKFIDEYTDRVHPNYLQFSTATGRLSTTSPAIQTIPRDNRIRNFVIPSSGNKLLIADLNQAELRVLAMLSEDQEMLRAFASGYDIHRSTACNALLHISYDLFDKSNEKHATARSLAKNINFGVIYGLSAYSLALGLDYPMNTPKEINDSTALAQKYIDSWFKLYNGADRWLKWIRDFALKNCFVDSIHGRRRHLPLVKSSEVKVRESALRQAMNMPIQASASDITNFAMIRLQNWIDKTNKKALLVSVIHDAILVDCPENEIEEVGEMLVKSLTEDVPGITIGLKADLDVLDKWNKN